MAFRSEALVEKLNKLNATQQSIETTSQWCIFYRKEAKKVVETWSAEFISSKDVNKKLAMIYLANDILQNSRKKGGQFVVEFYHKLPAAFHQLARQGDAKTKSSMLRMIQVWEERRVFGGSGVRPFMDAVKNEAKPGQRHVVLQSAQPSIERLSGATNEAAEAQGRSAAMAEKSQAVVCQDLSTSSADDLAAGLKILQQHATSLQNEIGHCERVLSILHHLTHQQEEAKATAERQLEGCLQMTQRHQQTLKVRQESDALLTAGSQGSGAETQSAVFQPADGHLPVGNGAGRPLEASANQTQPPSSTSAAAVSDLLGGFSQGGAGGQGSSAADLVAQLSQSGASAQMLFDAISALPQVDQSAQPKPPEEEEYDPEIGL